MATREVSGRPGDDNSGTDDIKKVAEDYNIPGPSFDRFVRVVQAKDSEIQKHIDGFFGDIIEHWEQYEDPEMWNTAWPLFVVRSEVARSELLSAQNSREHNLAKLQDELLTWFDKMEYRMGRLGGPIGGNEAWGMCCGLMRLAVENRRVTGLATSGRGGAEKDTRAVSKGALLDMLENAASQYGRSAYPPIEDVGAVAEE